MIYKNSDHTFVICAFKESEYLEECIKSVLSQSVKSNIFISTSTPNDYIYNIADKYGLKVFVNDGEKGIGGDWNFGYDTAKTSLVTLAHQDDIYEPDYLKEVLEFLNRSKEPIMYFCGYGELREGKKIYGNKLLKVKRLMLSPLKIKAFWKSIFIRRRVISFGNAICCPAVTMVKEMFGTKPFTNDYLSNIDWQQWEIQSKKRGSFVYNSKPLMCHRIHSNSTTSKIIGDNKRIDEDYNMFLKFWCKPIAKLLSNLYSQSQKSNNC